MKAFIVPTTLEFNMWEEDVRIIGVEMKSFNTNRTDNGEGKPLCICTLKEEQFNEKLNWKIEI